MHEGEWAWQYIRLYLSIVSRRGDRSSFVLGVFYSRYKSHLYVQVDILPAIY